MKPILFSTDMVRAIQKNRKTQTRRVAKPQPADISGICEHEEGFSPIGGNLYECGGCSERIEPRYQPGDILWVRETFSPNYFDDHSPAYKADYYKERIGSEVPEPKWKPAIHMPRTAARIFLRVTGVRAERVQEISDADAHAEGMDSPSYPIIQYKDLWNDLNDKRGYGWDINPWVWVYTFERVTEEGEPYGEDRADAGD